MRLLAPVLAFTVLPALQAQFFQRLMNPEVKVELTHPPALGLKVQRVAFAPVDNAPSEDFVAACIAELSATGQLDLVDRQMTAKLLAEQKFSNSGLVDSSQAVELGKVLGSPVLLLLKVTNQQTRRDQSRKESTYKDKEGKVHTSYTYTRRTQVDFAASVQAVDTATGRIYSARRLVLAPVQEATSSSDYPEYPSEARVREEAIQKACLEVIHLLLPWKESRKLVFYDDRDYGMKEAHRHLQAGDYAGALEKAKGSLAQAKADASAGNKYLGRTHYNLGICHFILGDYDAALPVLKAARITDPDNGIFKEATAECERALALRAEMAQVDARSGGTAGARPAARPSDGRPSLEERLERLNSLKAKGLISESEYQAKKAELLKEI